MSEKITLKPCPFCGGEAALQYGIRYEDKWHDDYFCFCDECEAETKYFSTAEQAIEAWNRRAYEEEMTEMLDDCLEELTFCESESAEDLKDRILAFLDRIHGEEMKS